MARFAEFNFDGIRELRDQIENLEKDMDNFINKAVKNIALRAIRKIKRRTPVDGGTLRAAWRINDIRKQGNEYIVEIINEVEYAEWVEYGHRQEVGRYVPAIGKKLVNPWVHGKFMMTISLQEIDQEIDKIMQKELRKWIKSRVRT